MGGRRVPGWGSLGPGTHPRGGTPLWGAEGVWGSLWASTRPLHQWCLRGLKLHGTGTPGPGHLLGSPRGVAADPRRGGPSATHRDTTAGPAEKARRPTDPRETATPGHPRYPIGGCLWIGLGSLCSRPLLKGPWGDHQSHFVGSLTPEASQGGPRGAGFTPAVGGSSATHGNTTAGPAATSGEKRAAQLIPARRPPQATHGTCGGESCSGRAAVAPPWAPRRRGPPHRRPVGSPASGDPGDHHRRSRWHPPRPHAAASGKKSAPRQLIPARR